MSPNEQEPDAEPPKKNPLGITPDMLRKEQQRKSAKPRQGLTAQEKAANQGALKGFRRSFWRYCLLLVLALAALVAYELYYSKPLQETPQDANLDVIQKETSFLLRDKEMIEGKSYQMPRENAAPGAIIRHTYPAKFILYCEGQQFGKHFLVEVDNTTFYSLPRNTVLDYSEISKFRFFASRAAFDAHYAAIEVPPAAQENNVPQKKPDNFFRKYLDK